MGNILNEIKVNYKIIIAWMLLLFAGLVYMTTGITHEALWYDETYSGAIINHSIPDIWNIAGSDSHPPFYFIALKLFCLFFGKAKFGLRLFSVIGVLALAALGMGPVRRIFGKATGFIYSFIVLVVPVSLFMGQEARMYTWAAFLVTGCLLYGYLAVNGSRKYDWVMFGVYTVFAAYVHYYALLAAALINFYILIVIIVNKRQYLKIYFITAGIAVIGYLPWVFSLASQVSRISKDFWIPPVTGNTIFRTLLYPFSLKFTTLPPLLYNAVPAFIIIVFLIFRGVVAFVKDRFNEGKAAIFALLIYLSTLLAGVIISSCFRPVFIERYSVPVVGMLIIAAAYGISRLKNISRMVIACIILLLSVSPFIVKINEQRYNGPVQEMKTYLQGNMMSDDIFIHTDENTFGIFSYYYPQNKQYMYLIPGFNGYSGYDAFAPAGTSGHDVEGFIKGHKNIWLVTSVYSPGVRAVNLLIDSGVIKAKGEIERFFSTSSKFAFTLRRVEPGRDRSDTPTQAGKLTVKFNNMKDRPGPIQIFIFNKDGFFVNDNGIARENLYMTKDVSVIEAKAGVVIDNVPYGNYAVAALHDLDENGSLSMKNGFSTDGVGVTNTLKGFEAIATFEACVFPIKSDEKTVEVEMIYPD